MTAVLSFLLSFLFAPAPQNADTGGGFGGFGGGSSGGGGASGGW